MTIQILVDENKELFNLAGVAATFTSANYPSAELFTTFGIQVDVTAAAALNFSLQIQASVDGVTWGDYGTAITVTANGTYLWNVTGYGFRYLKIVGTRTAGSATFVIKALGKTV